MLFSKHDVFDKSSGTSLIDIEKWKVLVTSTLNICEMNPMSYDIWQFCNGVNTVNAILNKLLRKYRGEAKEIERFLSKTLVQMCRANLIFPKKRSRRPFYLLYHKAINSIWLPSKIWISPVEGCNFSCPHCDSWERKRRMSKGDAKKILTRLLRRSFVNPVLWITGGEPFLHPHLLLTIVNLAKKAMNYDSPYFIIETNATLVTREVIDQIRQVLVEPVATRCMTLEESFNSYVLKKPNMINFIVDLDPIYLLENGREFLPQVKNGVEIINDADMPVQGSITFHGPTMTFVNTLRNVQQDWGKMEVFIKLPKKMNAALSYQKLLTIINEAKSRGLNTQFLDDQLFRIHNCNMLGLPPQSCAGRVIAINSLGDVFFCVNVLNDYRYKIGNLKVAPLSSILRSKRRQEMSAKIRRKINECLSKCCLAYYCGGCCSPGSLSLEERCTFAKRYLTSLVKHQLSVQKRGKAATI